MEQKKKLNNSIFDKSAVRPKKNETRKLGGNSKVILRNQRRLGDPYNSKS